MIKPIAVYDGHTRKRLAYLQNAYDISYSKSTTALWTGEFSLPYSDPKTQYCQAFNYVELWDEDGGGNTRYVGLFRIMPRTEETLGTEANIRYQLEHVLSTLLDDVMIGFHEKGNLGVYTNAVIGYILENQSEERWILGECDYSHQFLYGWENENLLSALFSIPQPFEETDYYWDFDTTVFPWTLHLRKTSKNPITDIRYRKNLNGINRVVDPTNLTTRLYCYGYGQGDNKLGITDVNQGIPFLESANVAKYGVVTQIWTDERFTIAESLLEVGRAMLKRLEEPVITYTIDIQTIYNAGNLQIGDTVRVVSTGLDELMTVKELSKNDVSGEPQSGQILLGEGTIDVSDSLAELADRQRIAETYSQGAESIFTDSFMDNVDAEHPGIIYFTIPNNAVHVNEISLSCKLTNFRAYSRAVKGGGAGTPTTEAGGDAVLTSSERGVAIPTSSSAGGATLTSSERGGSIPTSSSAGKSSPTSESDDTSNIWNLSSPYINDVISFNEGHTHGIVPHNHKHKHTVKIDSHEHTVKIDPHTHTVKIDPHTHTVNIDPHKHDISLPNHTHDIEYGVFEHDRVPTTMKIYLKVPGGKEEVLILNEEGGEEHSSNVQNLNLIIKPLIEANGKVMRGECTIKIVPGCREYNDAEGNILYDSKARIEASFLIRLFTNMHGGSQY